MNSTWNILTQRIVKYSSCIHKSPMLWILLGGHLRTYDKNVYNIRNMATKSSSCPFVCIYTREFLAEGTFGYGNKLKKPIKGNVSGIIENSSKHFPNFAYAITRSSAHIPRHWAHLDTWYAGMYFMNYICKTLDIKIKRQDMLLFSRPDIVYSHYIELNHIYNSLNVFYLAHNSHRAGYGNDPTELFVLMNYEVWNKVLNSCKPYVETNKIKTCPKQMNCVNKTWDPVAEAVEYSGASLAYANADFSIGIVRPRGRICLNGRGCSVKKKNTLEGINFKQNMLPFHSRCHKHEDFLYRKAMIHHYVLPRRTSS